jgi:hypothetical protein
LYNTLRGAPIAVTPLHGRRAVHEAVLMSGARSDKVTNKCLIPGTDTDRRACYYYYCCCCTIRVRWPVRSVVLRVRIITIIIIIIIIIIIRIGRPRRRRRRRSSVLEIGVMA